MPFTKLANNHSCPTPKARDDGTSLVVGDEWQCDEVLNELLHGGEVQRVCNKKWRWHTDQREGEFWMPIIER